MPRLDYVFPLGMIVAISLLATVSGLAVQRLFGLSPSTIIVGPLVAIVAVLIWSQSKRA